MTPNKNPGRRRLTRSTPVWQLPPGVMELFPEVSGNLLNGVGEAEVRSPNVVMWANPSTIAHGRVQAAMTEEFIADPDLAGVLRLADGHTPGEVAPDRVTGDPAAFTAAMARFATVESPVPVELFGVAAVDPAGSDLSHARPKPCLEPCREPCYDRRWNKRSNGGLSSSAGYGLRCWIERSEISATSPDHGRGE